MHSKQLKHFKPLNPDSSRELERVGELDREGCDEEEWGGGRGVRGESLSHWEMTNAICPEHSACVNPRQVPADPHPTLRPLQPPPQILTTSLLLCLHQGGWINHREGGEAQSTVKGAPRQSQTRGHTLQNICSSLSGWCLLFGIAKGLSLLAFSALHPTFGSKRARFCRPKTSVLTSFQHGLLSLTNHHTTSTSAFASAEVER